MPRRRPKDWQSKEVDVSDPVSSMTLWKALFRPGMRRGTQALAVVFSPPPEAFPADLFLEVSAPLADPLLARLHSAPDAGYSVTAESVDFVRDAAAQGFIGDLDLVVHSAEAIGHVLHHFLAVGAAAWAYPSLDESMEVVFRQPIPAKAIHSLVPLYETNVQARARKLRG